MLVIRVESLEMQTGKTLIRLLLHKQSDLGLSCLSMPFGRQLVFETLEHLPICLGLNVCRIPYLKWKAINLRWKNAVMS